MRHHITDDFLSEFYAGVKFYLQGGWPEAIAKLEHANDIIVDAALEEGSEDVPRTIFKKDQYSLSFLQGRCQDRS
eukprot:scaffold9979_cov130-Cylindrotheca_fusiformis.AAC.3